MPGTDFDGIGDDIQWQVGRQVTTLPVEFYENPQTGQPHFRCTVDQYNVIDRPVMEEDKMRYPTAWKVFTGEMEKFAGQTRIETQSWVDQGIIKQLKYNDIHTVEHLAGLTDERIGALGMMGLRKLRDRAVTFVGNKAKLEQFDVMKKQAEELAALKKQMAQMQASQKVAASAIVRNETEVKKLRRGRPAKAS